MADDAASFRQDTANTRTVRAWLARGVPPLALGAGALLVFVFVGARLDERWVPHDDGSLAHSAERVLSGELPHRDYAELYTGGLTFLNAALFGLLGEDLIWLRVPLFVLFVVFIPCVYWIARRYVGTAVAGLAALFAAAWTLPLYPAAMPSWYLLFFAAFGGAAALRYLDTGRRRWLVIAGVFGGLSIAFKIVGVWYVLAVLLFLVFLEQESRPRAAVARRLPELYATLLGIVLLGSIAIVASVLKHWGGAEIANLLLPTIAVCAVVAWNELQISPAIDSGDRIRAVMRLVVPFLAGVAVPVLLIAAPFLVTGSLDDLLRGVLIAPQTRLEHTYVSTPDPAYLLFGAPLVLMLLARRTERRFRKALDVGFVIVAAGALVLGSHDDAYALAWKSARALGPLIVFLGAVTLSIAWGDRAAPRDRRPVLLLVGLAAFVGLSQYPFGTPLYYCYAVPLFALCAIAVVRYAGLHRGLFPVALLALYTAFGFVWLDRSPQTLGAGFGDTPQYVTLDPARASIGVDPLEQAEYQHVVSLLRQHSSGQFTYAGPDAPELYYLSGLENPTRALFDFVDESGSARRAPLLNALRDRGVDAIAINHAPGHSPALEPTTVRLLRLRYANELRIGRFEVRWR